MLYNVAIATLSIEKRFSVPTATSTFISGSGETDRTSVSGDTAAHAAALLTAENQLKSGQSILTATASDVIDPTTVPLGHSDAAEEATFSLFDPTTRKRASYHFDEISLTYKSTLNDGTINIGHADVVAWLAALNTAKGTAYVIRHARYS